MNYTIYGCYFGAAFEAMAHVWRESLRQHCPTARVELDVIPGAPRIQNVRKSGPDNLAKLAYWTGKIQEATEPVLFLDVDTYCRQDLEPVWEQIGPADIAYTWRPRKERPVIGGFIAARPTDAARLFFHKWLAMATSLIMDPSRAWTQMNVRGGLNQACLSMLTGNPPDGCDVAELSPYVWNLCDEVWGSFDPEACRLVHCKGELRDHVQSGKTQGEYGHFVKEWKRYLRAGVYAGAGR